MRGLSPLSGERCQSKKTWLIQPPNMTLEEDFVVKEKSQTLESQLLLWTLETPPMEGIWRRRQSRGRRWRERKIRFAGHKEVHQRHYPGMLQTTVGSLTWFPTWWQVVLDPKVRLRRLHSANTLPINEIFKFPANFSLWTAGLWWSRHLWRQR